jgi:hypothetical protein
MKEKPIIFSSPMVRAILNGTKTMTRRIVKPQPKYPLREKNGRWYEYSEQPIADKMCNSPWGHEYLCPYTVGQILWVRETFSKTLNEDYIYRADPVFDGCGKGDISWKWTSPIFLPRLAARIILKVTNVKVEWLQDITEEDAIAEGFENRLSIIDGLTRELMEKAANDPAKANFIRLWNNLDRNHTGYDWEDNPWVWVIEFGMVR